MILLKSIKTPRFLQITLVSDLLTLSLGCLRRHIGCHDSPSCYATSLLKFSFPGTPSALPVPNTPILETQLKPLYLPKSASMIRAHRDPPHFSDFPWSSWFLHPSLNSRYAFYLCSPCACQTHGASISCFLHSPLLYPPKSLPSTTHPANTQ